MTTINDIARSRNILLTTYTKDGRAKPTVIWAAPDRDRLLVITEADSWKVKRIRNNPKGTVAASDRRGHPTSAPLHVTATILDAAQTADAYAIVARHYGVIGALVRLTSKIAGRMHRNVGIALTPTDNDDRAIIDP